MRLPFGRGRRADAPLVLELPLLWQFSYTVYFYSRGNKPPEVAALLGVVEQWLDRHSEPPFRDAVKKVICEGLVSLRIEEREALPEPEADILRAYHPGELEERRFLEATHGIVVNAPDLRGHSFVGFWAAIAAARALAAASGGAIFDPVVGRLLPERTYLLPLPAEGAVAVGDHLMIPSSLDEKGRGWITTAGLRRFDLPELELRDAPPNLIDHLWVVVNAVAQLLLEAISGKVGLEQVSQPTLALGPELRVDVAAIARSQGAVLEEPPAGARGWTTVRLEQTRGGTAHGFLRIVRPHGTHAGHGEWLHSLLTDLAGTQDTLRMVGTGSEAMEIAHRRALAELSGIKARFLAGLPVGCVLYVKHGFPHGKNSHEYMWLAVNTWNGNKVRCQLVNTPTSRQDLRAGQEFELAEAELFDWYLTWPDGRTEGGYTTQVAEADGRA
jgi:uncharacterized protein YegJ (DUF2314 family)